MMQHTQHQCTKHTEAPSQLVVTRPYSPGQGTSAGVAASLTPATDAATRERRVAGRDASSGGPHDGRKRGRPARPPRRRGA
uniref:Uncharacterized protein n=1 Tax=Arundo donax TaxID=35708 RepID=A0A0A8YCG1_ARUDO